MSYLDELLKDIEDDRRKHPVKWLWIDFKWEAYCLITNNRLMRWIKYKIRKN